MIIPLRGWAPAPKASKLFDRCGGFVFFVSAYLTPTFCRSEQIRWEKKSVGGHVVEEAGGGQKDRLPSSFRPRSTGSAPRKPKPEPLPNGSCFGWPRPFSGVFFGSWLSRCLATWSP